VFFNRRPRWWRGLARTALPAFLAAAPASAHTQFPVVRDIQFQPGDPERIVAVAEAAGIFASSDAGRTWTFVCAQSFAVDPYFSGIAPSVVLKDGVIAVAGGTAGLRLSADDGCNFTRPSDFDGKNVIDVASRGGSELFVLTSEQFDADFVTSILVSKDGGTSFGAAIRPPGNAIPSDLAVAPSDGTLYVVTRPLDTDTLALLRSLDAGLTWKTVTLPPLQSPIASARVMAVDPKNPAIVFVQTSDTTDGDVAEYGLWVTSTGGATWTRLLSTPLAIAGPTYSPDGARIAFGGSMGVYRGHAADVVRDGLNGASLVIDTPVFGLGWSESGLFAGGNDTLIEDVDRFAIGVDRGDAGAFAPVLDLCDLKARQCPMGSTLSQCGNQTHVLSEVIDLPVCTQPRTSGDGGKAPPSEGPSAKPGEDAVEAGLPPAPGAPPRPGEHDAGTSPADGPTPPHDSSACSVSFVGASGETPWLPGIVGALALLLGRRGGRAERCDGAGQTRRVRRF
jgi:hypothetical protein